MMLFLWLIVWWTQDFPPIVIEGTPWYNSPWLIALLVCAALSLPVFRDS